jgi:hypothetical protein
MTDRPAARGETPPPGGSLNHVDPGQSKACVPATPAGSMERQGAASGDGSLTRRPLLSRIARSTKTWLVIVAGFGVLAAAVLVARKLVSPETANQEFFRFSLTVVVGGVIAFVFRMAEARRQVRDARQRELRDFYRRMLAAYNEAKKTRRLLRAYSHEVGESVEIPLKDLDDLMDKLQSAQLDFEALRREADVSRQLFTDQEVVERHLGHAQDYLRQVLKVHEGMSRTDARMTMWLNASDCRPLLCFFHDPEKLAKAHVPKEDCQAFDARFSDQVNAVRRLIVGASEEAVGED